jgi:uncharacterized protein (TIGR02996 family)
VPELTYGIRPEPETGVYVAELVFPEGRRATVATLGMTLAEPGSDEFKAFDDLVLSLVQQSLKKSGVQYPCFVREAVAAPRPDEEDVDAVYVPSGEDGGDDHDDEDGDDDDTFPEPGPEESALVRAVVEDPFADAPRLAFAQWAEDNGHRDRADEIRRQVRTGEAEPWTSRYDPRLTGVVRRGWPDELHIRAGLFEPSLVRLLFASYPITAVKFIDRPGIQFIDQPNEAALSRAAVVFGRELAGVPPLTWPPV